MSFIQQRQRSGAGGSGQSLAAFSSRRSSQADGNSRGPLEALRDELLEAVEPQPPAEPSRAQPDSHVDLGAYAIVADLDDDLGAPPAPLGAFAARPGAPAGPALGALASRVSSTTTAPRISSSSSSSSHPSNTTSAAGARELPSSPDLLALAADDAAAWGTSDGSSGQLQLTQHHHQPHQQQQQEQLSVASRMHSATSSAAASHLADGSALATGSSTAFFTAPGTRAATLDSLLATAHLASARATSNASQPGGAALGGGAPATAAFGGSQAGFAVGSGGGGGAVRRAESAEVLRLPNQVRGPACSPRFLTTTALPWNAWNHGQPPLPSGKGSLNVGPAVCLARAMRAGRQLCRRQPARCCRRGRRHVALRRH